MHTKTILTAFEEVTIPILDYTSTIWSPIASTRNIQIYKLYNTKKYAFQLAVHLTLAFNIWWRKKTYYHYTQAWNYTHQISDNITESHTPLQTRELQSTTTNTSHTHQKEQKRHICPHQTKHKAHIHYYNHYILEHREDKQTTNTSNNIFSQNIKKQGLNKEILKNDKTVSNLTSHLGK